jgi:Phycobilisome protein
MNPQLSETVKDLILKARIVSFAAWQQTHPPEAIARFQTADDVRQYLNDDELQQIQTLAPERSEFIPVVIVLRDRVTDIVDEARGNVLTAFPGITEPGGGLYPPERAAACWRDFWHFLRCITYGIAGHHTDYTSAEGLEAMNQLYHELQVPLDAMILGLDQIKTANLKRIDPQLHDALAPYFDHLIHEMQKFSAHDSGEFM